MSSIDILPTTEKGNLATMVATLTHAPGFDGAELCALRGLADWLLVRAEHCGDLDRDWIRTHYTGTLVYGLSPTAARGAARLDRLIWAAKHYDLVELHAPDDLLPEILARIPPEQRILCWSGVANSVEALIDQFTALATTPARLYRMDCAGDDVRDGLIPLQFLARLQRTDVSAASTGKSAQWNCLLAPYFGCPIAFGAVPGGRGHRDIPEFQRLLSDFGLPRLVRPLALYGIVGDPVTQSKSPGLHNGAFRAAGCAALYLPIQTADFEAFWTGVATDPFFAAQGMPFDGLTVVSPNKEDVARFVSRGTSIAQRSRSCNMVSRGRDGWRYSTSDPAGVLDCLAQCGIDPAGRAVAVVGCGGAGRAMAAALDEAGAHVAVVNRSTDRGKAASNLLGLPFVPLSAFDPAPYEIIVHATPLGRDRADPTPFKAAALRDGAVVVELVYGPDPTPLAQEATAFGHRVIDGHQVLAVQVGKQYEFLTGQDWAAQFSRSREASRETIA